MRNKYLGQQDFFCAHAKPSDSVVWRNILKCQELIHKGISWTIGDGKDVFFWHDNWIENTSLMDLLEVEDQDMVNFDLKVSDFIENKQWNIYKLRLYLNNQDIVHKVIGIPIPLTTIKDSFCWGLSSTGRFTTKSATWLAIKRFKEEPPWSFKWIWQIETMPKIKIFLWQMCHNALPVDVVETWVSYRPAMPTMS